MGDWSSLEADVETLIDAAIDRYLWDEFQVHRAGNTYFIYNSESDVKTFPARGHGSPPGTVEGYYPRESGADASTKFSFSPAEVYAEWATEINGLFAPYRSMPKPGDLAGSLTAVQAALDLLQVSPDAAADRSTKKSDGFKFGPGGSDVMAIGTGAGDTFALFQGATATAFKAAVLDRFGLVVTRQYAAAQMVKAGILCEQEVWKRLQVDVPNLVACATSAFQDSSGDVDYEIVGALLGVAGLIPGISAGAGVASAILGVLSVIPDGGGDKTSHGNISGGDAESILASLRDEVGDLNTKVSDQEFAMGQKLQEVRDFITGHPEVMDLTSQRELGDTSGGPTPGQELGSATDVQDVISRKGELVVETTTMRHIGNQFHDQLSKAFGAAAGHLSTAAGDGGTGWSRSGGIGYGYTGHHAYVASLVDVLDDLLRDQQQLIERAGDVLLITATAIDHADGDAERRLRAHRAEVAKVERDEASNEQRESQQPRSRTPYGSGPGY